MQGRRNKSMCVKPQVKERCSQRPSLIFTEQHPSPPHTRALFAQLNQLRSCLLNGAQADDLSLNVSPPLMRCVALGKSQYFSDFLFSSL